MQKFTDIFSKVIPLPIKDVDTGMILPAAFLTSVSRDGYGENVFRRLRDKDPNFPLDLPIYRGAQILVADDNFGCGSSREHAVWALMGWGLKVIIAKSFADIFYGNASKNGLLLIKLPAPQVDRLLELAKAQPLQLTISLEQQSLEGPSFAKVNFEYDPFRKHCLLSGLDDIDYILSHGAEIEQYRQKRALRDFFKVGLPNH